MRAAVIENGIVANIIVISDGYSGGAVHTGELPVKIGDSFDGTNFWRDGAKVEMPQFDTSDEYAETLRILGVEV